MCERKKNLFAHHVDMSFGSMPNLVHSVSCRPSACSWVKQLLSFNQPFSRKKSIWSCDSLYCSSAFAMVTYIVNIPLTVHLALFSGADSSLYRCDQRRNEDVRATALSPLLPTTHATHGRLILYKGCPTASSWDDTNGISATLSGGRCIKLPLTFPHMLVDAGTAGVGNLGKSAGHLRRGEHDADLLVDALK